MLKIGKKVAYIKTSIHHGQGSIPLNSIGEILKLVQNPKTNKVLVDFGKHGKAILPLSCIREVE